MLQISVLGSKYSVLCREEVNAYLVESALKGRPGYVCVSNVHTTMMGLFDASYQKITNSSFLSVPDGVPLVWAMNALGAVKILGRPQDRVRGPTLMRDLCDQGRAHRIKHYLYGGSPNTIRALSEILQREYPGIEIVGAQSPPYRALTEEEMSIAAKEINDSGAHFLWVGLGAPKQENWMWLQRDRVRPIMLGVGAAFDLLPGIVPEAPLYLQKLGLEWLYRFYREPRRLWRRYIFNNPAFLVLLFCQLILGKMRKLWEIIGSG